MATSKAVAAVKRAKVVEAVANGATYEQAAQQAGYATRSGAYKAFWRALGDRQADSVDQHRTLEVQRLDALQAAMWDKPLAGDIKALNAVLRIIEQRSRLLGLDKLEAEPAGSGSVVDPDYWAALKETQAPDAPLAGDADSIQTP